MPARAEGVNKLYMEDKDKKEEINKYISIEDFAKIEIKLGTIVQATEVEGSNKLYQLTVDFGESSTRNVMSGIRKYKSIDDLLNKQFPFVTNLAPRQMMGKYVSEAMILAASASMVDEPEELFSLFPSEIKLPNGTQLR